MSGKPRQAQAKGKIERRHDYWQKRLPALLAADQILELCGANHLLDQLVLHANEHEIHRELGTTPQAARDLALTEKRSVLRPAPACPWWPFIWSQRTRVRGGDDGKVPVRDQRHSLDAPPPLSRHSVPAPRWRHLLPPADARSPDQTLGSPPRSDLLKPCPVLLAHDRPLLLA